MNHSIKYVLGVLLIGLAGFVVGCEIGAKEGLGLGCKCISNADCESNYCLEEHCAKPVADCFKDEDCFCGQCLEIGTSRRCKRTCDIDPECFENEYCGIEPATWVQSPEYFYFYCVSSVPPFVGKGCYTVSTGKQCALYFDCMAELFADKATLYERFHYPQCSANAGSAMGELSLLASG